MDYQTAIDYLRQNPGRVPCSRYGWNTESCAPIAAACAVIMQGETAEPSTYASLDHMMGLVVNDHEDPAYLMANYGPEYGFNPEEFDGVVS